MQHQNRHFSLKILISAGAFLVLVEILNLTILHRWLGNWFFVRHHLPGLLFLALLLVVGFVSYYEYHGIGPQDGIVRRGHNLPVVALTFDDGPNPKYTLKILDILKEKRASATFFMVGRHVEKYPDVARRVYRDGHDIGNHTYSHRDLVPVTRKTVLKEVNKTDEVLKRVVGVKTRLFRPPRGIYSNAVRKILVDELGYTVVLWTVSAADWSGMSPARMTRRVRYYTRNGGVILFHDSGAILRSEGADRGNTVEALPLIIDELRKRGFRIVRLSEMLQELDYVERESFVEDVSGTVVGQEI